MSTGPKYTNTEFVFVGYRHGTGKTFVLTSLLLIVCLIALQFWFGGNNVRYVYSNRDNNVYASDLRYNYNRSELERNQTAELIFLVWGSDEQEMERKRQECLNNGMLFAEDKILPENFARYNDEKRSNADHTLPNIIHVTSKTRCLTKPFYDNLERWKSITDYSLLFHDDDAKYRLIHNQGQTSFLSSSKELPNMEYVLACMKNRGAMLADLWRYLLIYEYGGIYVDIDEAPGEEILPPSNPEDFFDSTSRDALFIFYPKGSGVAQYFFALSPKHPFLFYTLLATFFNLYSSKDIMGQYVPYVTGSPPSAAWALLFNGERATPGRWHIKNKMVANRSMDLIHKDVAAKYIVRDPPWLSGEVEKEYYRKINATDYQRNYFLATANRSGVHCWDMLYDVHVNRSGTILDLA